MRFGAPPHALACAAKSPRTHQQPRRETICRESRDTQTHHVDSHHITPQHTVNLAQALYLQQQVCGSSCCGHQKATRLCSCCAALCALALQILLESRQTVEAGEARRLGVGSSLSLASTRALQQQQQHQTHRGGMSKVPTTKLGSCISGSASKVEEGCCWWCCSRSGCQTSSSGSSSTGQLTSFTLRISQPLMKVVHAAFAFCRHKRNIHLSGVCFACIAESADPVLLPACCCSNDQRPLPPPPR